MSDLANVKGLDQLQKLLDTLPAKIEANVMRGALRAGIKLMHSQAKANAPVGDPNSENRRLYGGYRGALRDSIKIKTKRKGARVTASVVAGGKSKSGADVFYAHMIEFGTSRHTITGKDGRALFFGGAFVDSVDHPGTKPRPFMRPAFDGQARQAIAETGRYVKKRLSTKNGLDTAHINIDGDE